MKKKFSAIALALVIGSVMISCGEGKNNLKEDNNISIENQVEKVPVILSNITSKEMQGEVKTLLINNNINEENAGRYINYINDFNERVKDKSLLKEDFVTIDSINGLYNSIILKDKISEDGSILGEINCRLASFELFKEFVSTKGEIQPDNYLIFDIEAINNNPIISFTDEDKKKYINLFNPVDIGNVKDTDEIVKLIKEELNKREVKIDNQGKVSLINIYINDEVENKMFVGHSVVMIENDDEYVVLEKFSPMDPFQISKFSSREDVKKYLLSRNDIYGSDINPIVLINNEEF
ncbi:DUF4300 family protein [Clostridium sp.]|uniref:DUF4300 family protein n=1 Tax=Clostridium sp. TaxID=1506 RepID=UPI00261EAB11|nr:DUF4300 family protein [Clostridium sp.]